MHHQFSKDSGSNLKGPFCCQDRSASLVYPPLGPRFKYDKTSECGCNYLSLYAKVALHL